MTYRLEIPEEAAKVLAVMDEVSHELFVLAMLDLPRDPHGLGHLVSAEGPFTRRAVALGNIGLIVYVVNDFSSTVTVSSIIWIG